MDHAPSREPQSAVEHAHSLSNNFAELLPRDGADVGAFLYAAASALGEREADMARRIGVSQATFSSWKRRGAIPEPQLPWFTSEFVPAIFQQQSRESLDRLPRNGVEIALAVFRVTEFDPFRDVHGDELRRIVACSMNIAPLAKLGWFVTRRLEHEQSEREYKDFFWNRLVPKVIELARSRSQPHWR